MLFKAGGAVELVTDWDGFSSGSPRMVMFFAPWDPKSVSAAAAFTGAAKDLEGAVLFGAVDCTQSSKICKKHKIKGLPVIQHIENGGQAGTSRVYQGPRLSGGIASFARDPTSKTTADALKSEHSRVTLLTGSKLLTFVEEASLVLFHSDGFADHKGKSAVAEAAEQYTGEAGVGALDCAVHAAACQQLGLLSTEDAPKLPQLWYFKAGRLQFVYPGAWAGAEVLDFFRLLNPYLPAPHLRVSPTPAFSPADLEGAAITALEATTIEGFLQAKEAIIMFHTPWSAESLRFKPAYIEGSIRRAVESPEHPIKLGVFDCADPAHVAACVAAGVLAVPAIFYFQDGQAKLIYEGRPELKGMMPFLEDPKTVPPTRPAGPPPFLEAKNGTPDPRNEWVPLLTDTDFPKFIAENDRVMVMFYAPWCGYCTEAKPHFANAAGLLVDPSRKDKAGVLVAVDCTTTGKATCGQYGANSYPTFKYFYQGSDEQTYQGPRARQAFVDFMEVQANNPRRQPVARARDPPSRKPRPEVQSEVESEIRPELKTAVGTEELQTREGFEAYAERTKGGRAVVMFQIDKCVECTGAQEQVAAWKTEALITSSAIVDCTKLSSLCREHKLRAFPSFGILDKGVLVSVITGRKGALVRAREALDNMGESVREDL